MRRRLSLLAAVSLIASLALPVGGALADQCKAAGDHAAVGGVDLGALPHYLFLFADGSDGANWQGATKGFAGDVAVNGLAAKERTSGKVPYAGSIFTNDDDLGAWDKIVDQNAGQAAACTDQVGVVEGLIKDLHVAFAEINSLKATPGWSDVDSDSLDGMDMSGDGDATYVINITDGFKVDSQINIVGDAGDVFVLRWDKDADPSNGYQGEVKFQSGGAIVPGGDLTPASFIHTAGSINSSGGGSTPAAPFPSGPRLEDGALIDGGQDFKGGGYFTGYWLTTGDPKSGKTSSFSNAIFVGGWYTLSTKFSMTSGTSGVHVAPPTTTGGGGDDPNAG